MRFPVREPHVDFQHHEDHVAGNPLTIGSGGGTTGSGDQTLPATVGHLYQPQMHQVFDDPENTQ